VVLDFFRPNVRCFATLLGEPHEEVAERCLTALLVLVIPAPRVLSWRTHAKAVGSAR
jgi:hypothetical protein